jgi:hypothetical protein
MWRLLNFRLLLLSGLASLMLLAAVPATAITGGQPDGNGHPNVGLVILNFGSGPRRECSGVLIAPTKFLTAAHCMSFLSLSQIVGVTFDPTYDPNTSTVIPAAAMAFDPLFGKDLADLHDLAVITLASPAAATPVVLPTAGLLDQLAAKGALTGADFTNVGYGATGWTFGGGQPQPVDFFTNVIRRVSTSPFQALTQNVLKLQGQSEATDEGGTCTGDSGSARYLNVGGIDVAVATVSLGSSHRCEANNSNYRLDTASARAFLGQFVTLP